MQLLDWEDSDEEYIMVLECPSPCMDLCDFMDSKGGTVNEGLAQVIMQQVTKAALACSKRGVFHRDIKPENIMINPKTLQIKLIDFGCGDLRKKQPYTISRGMFDHLRCVI